MADSAIERAAPGPASPVMCALHVLGATMVSGHVRETTLATAAVYACKEAANGVIQAGLEQAIWVGVHWLQAAVAWLV